MKLNTEIYKLWAKLYPMKPKPFEQWASIHTMDLRVLYIHELEMTAHRQIFAADEEDIPAADKKIITLRNMSVSFNSVDNYSFDVSLCHLQEAEAIATYQVNDVNPYHLLKVSGGVQPIELANIASLLGSASHTWSALICLQEKPNLVNGIVDSEKLEEYNKLQPSRTKVIGGYLADIIKDKVAAVEYPIYSKGFYCYSRIDAITLNFKDNEGYAVWEYKTRWGNDRKCLDRPDTIAIEQAAYYCYILGSMINQRIRYCYIVYAINLVNEIKLVTHRVRIDKDAIRLL